MNYYAKALSFVSIVFLVLALTSCNRGRNIHEALYVSNLRETLVADAEEHNLIETIPAYEDFPTLSIIMYDGISPFVDKELWIDSSFSLDSTHSNWRFEGITGSVSGHADSTWLTEGSENKRSLRISFDEARPVTGSDASHTDWVLLANHFDLSLLRGHVAFELAKILGHTGFVPFSQFVHLYVNDEYMGVYQLVDDVSVANGRVELSFSPNPVWSEYLIWRDMHDQGYEILFPASYLHNGHAQYVYQFIVNVSDAIQAENWELIQTLIDVDSFVNFYIQAEFLSDIAINSVFLHIRGQDHRRRLFFGPVWDFDLAAGNDIRRFDTEFPFVALRHYWFHHLIAIPEFRNNVADRWNELRDNEIVQFITDIENKARQWRPDFERNFERHPLTDIRSIYEPRVFGEIDTFMGHVDFLTDWLMRRAYWMDGYINN